MKLNIKKVSARDVKLIGLCLPRFFVEPRGGNGTHPHGVVLDSSFYLQKKQEER
jgi:hypothetical protein